MQRVKKIVGDGNCMFRSLSYAVTGSESNHTAIRAKIVHQIKHTPSLLGHITHRPSYQNCKNVAQYIAESKMDQDGVWGTDIELLSFARLAKICVFTYNAENCKWNMYGPHNVDKRMRYHVGEKAIYILHSGLHYEVVLATEGGNPTPSGKVVRSLTDAEVPRAIKKSKSSCHERPYREWVNMRYHAVDEAWQRDMCCMFGLPFVRPNNAVRGSPSTILTPPETLHNIRPDGNCLFNCLPL